jgi:hypothetical protein
MLLSVDVWCRLHLVCYAWQLCSTLQRIHGRHLTAPELRTYVGAYVKLFHEGASFPEAKTMLEATSAANNSNAKFAAVAR